MENDLCKYFTINETNKELDIIEKDLSDLYSFINVTNKLLDIENDLYKYSIINETNKQLGNIDKDLSDLYECSKIINDIVKKDDSNLNIIEENILQSQQVTEQTLQPLKHISKKHNKYTILKIVTPIVLGIITCAIILI